MTITHISETDLANAVADQLSEWTGIPVESLTRMAREEFHRRGKTIKTSFGDLNIVESRWMPKDRALLVSKSSSSC